MVSGWYVKDGLWHHDERIKCPNCGAYELATVEHTHPWWSFYHECSKCEYIIMESEWDRVWDQLTKIKVGGNPSHDPANLMPIFLKLFGKSQDARNALLMALACFGLTVACGFYSASIFGIDQSSWLLLGFGLAIKWHQSKDD